MPLRLSALAAVLGSAALLAGCGGGDDAATTAASGTGAAAGTTAEACPVTAVPIVVSVNQWGDVTEALAGACGEVTTIIEGSSGDPHDYEPTASDIAEFGQARLVVVNGLDYDPWAARAAADVSPAPAVVDGGEVAGLAEGDNPHIWYGPRYVEQVSDAITAELKTLLPGAEEYLDARAAAWEADLAPYRDTITAIKDARSGSGVGATESVFDYMAEAAGLVDRTPAGWQRAAANESDPGPGDVAAFETALGDGSMDVLVYNTQTEGAITEQVRDAAVSDSVPVVNVTETVPDGQGWVDWQVGQLKALQTALGSG